jgi:hypothetical protein
MQPVLVGFAVVAVVAGSALVVMSEQHTAETLAARIDAARIQLDGLRLLTIATLIVLWSPLVRWRLRLQGLVDVATVESLAQHRWTLALVLLTIELVLVQNLPGRLWRLLP